MTKKDMIIILENNFIENYGVCVAYARLRDNADRQNLRDEYKKFHDEYQIKVFEYTELLKQLGMEKRLPELRRQALHMFNK